MTLDDARTLVGAVAAERGLIAPNGWQGGDIDGIGWVFGPRGVRGNVAFAVTGDGRLATYPPSSMSDHEAVALLASLPSEVVGPHPLARTGAAPVVVDAVQASAVALRVLPGATNAANEHVQRLLPRGWAVSRGHVVVVVADDGRSTCLAPSESAERALRRLEVPFLPRLAGGPSQG